MAPSQLDMAQFGLAAEPTGLAKPSFAVAACYTLHTDTDVRRERDVCRGRVGLAGLASVNHRNLSTSSHSLKRVKG